MKLFNIPPKSHTSRISNYRMKRLLSVPNSSDGLIFVKIQAKDGRFLSKNTDIRLAKRRAKFKFCPSSSRSLRVQSVTNIIGWKIGVNKTNGHFYHSLSYQDHHSGFVI